MNNSIFMRIWRREPTGGKLTLAFLLALLVLIPALNLLVPATSFLHVSTYTVTLLGKYLCFALLALSMDLAWGYLGILSLGHGAFFALGAYAMGMYLMRQIGTRGVYGNADLPDFMVFLNWTELPWFWTGSQYFVWAAFMAFFIPGLLAFVVGWLGFRSRVSGVYLSIITQAMTYALSLAFLRNEMGFGGNNGLTDFKEILGFNLQSDQTRVVLFALTALIVICTYLFLQSLMNSRLGRLSVAVRDAEMRVRFVGFRVEHIKLLVFVLSAMIAGMAGALYVPQVGIINPSEFSPLASIEIVIWVALGGRGTLFGAIIGAFVVNYAKTYFTGAFSDYWLFLLGTMFVVVTVLMQRGLVGLFTKSKGASK
jgi:urea transport system permease protein